MESHGELRNFIKIYILLSVSEFVSDFYSARTIVRVAVNMSKCMLYVVCCMLYVCCMYGV